MLSIAQFVNGLAQSCPAELLSLDSKESLGDFFEEMLNEPLSDSLTPVEVSNRYFGVKSNHLFFQAKVRKRVQQLLQNGEDIVVYSRDYKQMAGLMDARWGRRRPYFIFESHQIQSQNLCRSGNFHNAEKLHRLEERVFNKVDAIVPITQTLSNEISRVFPEATDKRIVLPVGVSEKFFHISDRDKRYDLIYSGNFSQWKGVDTLLFALEKVKAEFPEIRVLLVGAHQQQMGLYQDLIRDLSLQNNIELRGRVPHAEIPDLIAQSRIGLVPVSYQEDGLLYTSPLKLYEYLAAGISVVAARVPSVMSVIPEELVHWAVPDDVGSYKEAIISALNGENRSNGQEFARNFTWKERGKKLIDFMEGHLINNSSGACS